ncbi:MAG TPA: hypothetical protein VF598_00290 [Hymenobacter sp.]
MSGRPTAPIVDVEVSPLSAGSTTLDVLTRSPSVTVGAGDAFNLKGRQGVLVLLDGKRVAMTGTELASAPLNSKKTSVRGTNGNLSASYSCGQYPIQGFFFQKDGSTR